MTVSALPAAILAESNIIGYWPMDDALPTTARDRGPNNFPGSYNANCLLGVTGIDGQPGGGVKFGEPVNLGQQMSVPFNAAFVQTAGSVEFCIRVWNFQSLMPGAQIFDAYGSSGPQVNTASPGSGHLGFAIKKHSVANLNTSTTSPIADTYLWHHVVITWDTAHAHIWIDGIDTAGVDTAETMTAGSTSSLAWGLQSTRICLAHCAYYSKVLDATAVATHYAAFQADNATWPTSRSLRFGLHQGLHDATSDDVRKAQIQALGQSHGTVSRSDFRWDLIQAASGGAYDWSLYDTLVSELAGQVQSCVFTVTQSPLWASGGATLQSIPGTSSVDAAFTTWVGKYQTFITDAMNRYKAGGAGNPHSLDIYWEVWNEPNDATFWVGGTSPKVTDGAMYGTLYKALYSSIKAANASAKVIFGPLTEWQNTGSTSTIAQVFLKDAIATGGVSIDYAGFHPYTAPTLGPDDITANNNMLSDLLSFRDTLLAKGYNVPILMTELGWHTANVGGEANQAAYVDTAFKRVRDQWSSFVSVALMYRDWDSTTNTSGLFATMPVLPTLPAPKQVAQNFYKIAAPFAREERVGRVLI